jgi:hypothetical protein
MGQSFTRRWIDLRHVALLTATVAVVASPSVSRAEVGAVGITATCPITGPGILICATAGLGLHELYKALNGQDAFGTNGEVMKALAAPVHIVDANIRGSERESGELSKVLKSVTGISARDIDHFGLWGGSNSIFRKPFG